MKTGPEIAAAVRPMYDRLSEALKVVGAGNTGGMVAMVTAINTVHSDHPHTEILLKPTAIIFALGFFIFAVAYYFLICAYVHCEHYTGLLGSNPTAVSEDANRSMNSSIFYMKWTFLLGVSSTYVFFVAFVIAFVALVRY
jgi:hypothetical protein